MTGWLLIGAAIALLAANHATFAAAGWRCRPKASASTPAPAPAVSIVIPLAGLEYALEETLRSAFALDYPDFELLLCIEDARDPAAALARRVMADHPEVAARLLVGSDSVGANPKLNNCVKGWREARHDWILIADSNALMPRDLVQHLLKSAGEGLPVTFSPPIGARPEGLWAEIECAFLNSLQARVLYTGDVLRANPVHGKAMLVRRAFLDERGGLAALTAERAEDVALRKIVNAARLRTRIVDAPVLQPLGRRTRQEVLRRQLRWAFLRRLALPVVYPLELLLGGLAPVALAGLGAQALGAAWWLGVGAAGAVLYGGEIAYVRRMGWWYSWRTPLALLLRDALFPGIWLAGLLARSCDWRGNRLDAAGPDAAMKGDVP